jgi:alanyl-tRNA synthetase
MIIPSSSVIPPKDSGTYFVNSGMNQFKNIFLSQHEQNSRQCVVNYQKCIRVGGKHNDLSDVGHDTYHHTFFEMLGNWSFNNAYFKRQACTMAYDLLTKVYGIEKNQLFFTYFQGEKNLVEPDYETKQIWIDLGIDPKRILPFGMKENFWEMGEIGPCGPCTEIHYDHTGQGDPSQVNRDNPRVVELWNLVFMQYERRQDKCKILISIRSSSLLILALIPLTNVHVDTGMGLERLVAVLNTSESNYDTDLFTPLFDTIHSYCPNSPVYSQANQTEQYAYRLLADHARMFTIAIGDGLVPEKKGIGGLLKKMIERATRIAYEYLHIDEENVAILSKLIPVVTKILSPAYPDLNEKLNRTVEFVQYGELNYMKKYQLAKPLLENFIQEKIVGSDHSISGNDIYRLYAGKIDNINVPLEMIEDYTSLFPSLKIDWSNFDELMREETRKSKLYSIYNKTIKTNENISHHPIEKLSDLLKQSSSIKSTIDDPYKYQADLSSLNAEIQLIIQIDQLNIVQSIDRNRKYYLLLDRTNFYSTSGGQSSDQGTIQLTNNLTFQVE